MIKYWRLKAAPLLGLDIGTTAVKLVELSHTASGFRVESYAVVPFFDDLDKVANASTLIISAIKQAIQQSKTRIKRAAIAVANINVITKVIQVDMGLNDAEIMHQIKTEAHQYMSYPIDDINLDYHIQAPSEEDSQLMEVLVVACQRDIINTRVGILEKAGLAVHIADAESYALERACRLAVSHLNKQDFIAMVEIDISTTRVTILHANETVYRREALFGGKALIEAIQQHHRVSYVQARHAVMNNGFSDDDKVKILQPFIEDIVQHMNHLLQFFFSSYEQTELDAILLAGDFSIVPGLAVMVEKHLQCETIVADPFLAMTTAEDIDRSSLKKQAPSLMISCGLAMRGFNHDLY